MRPPPLFAASRIDCCHTADSANPPLQRRRRSCALTSLPLACALQDEADELGDTVAILSHGQLRCQVCACVFGSLLLLWLVGTAHRLPSRALLVPQVIPAYPACCSLNRARPCSSRASSAWATCSFSPSSSAARSKASPVGARGALLPNCPACCHRTSWLSAPPRLSSNGAPIPLPAQAASLRSEIARLSGSQVDELVCMWRVVCLSLSFPEFLRQYLPDVHFALASDVAGELSFRISAQVRAFRT